MSKKSMMRRMSQWLAEDYNRSIETWATPAGYQARIMWRDSSGKRIHGGSWFGYSLADAIEYAITSKEWEDE